MLKIVILAAGKGKRVLSDKPKVLLEVGGLPMIDYSIKLAKSISLKNIIVVIGHGKNLVKEHLKSSTVKLCLQKEQLGTGDAVKVALKHINDNDQVLILSGDMPLIKSSTIKEFISKSQSDINFITVKTDNPYGYGRVVRSLSGDVIKIVEEKDANDYEKKINEVNTGVYLIKGKILKDRLKEIKNNNNQKEYYITDIIKDGVLSYGAEDDKEFLGVNDRIQQSKASRIIYDERCIELMKKGVSFIDPLSVYISESVDVGKDVVIYPNVVLEGKTVIGSGCKIYSGSRIYDSIIGSDCCIKDNTLIENSQVGDNCIIGPMAHLRPKTVLLGDNKIGNFVELKKVNIGKSSKVSHLSYLGDAVLGKDVNIGCGTITCNYDGYNKHETLIGNNVFVGSDVQFIAPVKVGSGAIVGAGSTITSDIPDDALGISRVNQKNYDNYGKLIMEKNKKKNKGKKE